EALAILSVVDPAEVKREADAAMQAESVGVERPMPASWVAIASHTYSLGSGLLRRAIEHVEPDALVHIESQLMTVANTVGSAMGIEPSDRLALKRLFEFTVGGLNIGLEFVAEANVESAARTLRNVPLRRIFQAGFSILSRLQIQVRGLVERGNLSLVEGNIASLLRADEADLVGGLAAPRPFRTLSDLQVFESHRQIDAAVR